MNRYALRDDHWDRIKDLLPGKPGDVGVAAHDNRRFVEAVLYRYRTGIPWRDLPERLCPVSSGVTVTVWPGFRPLGSWESTVAVAIDVASLATSSACCALSWLRPPWPIAAMRSAQIWSLGKPSSGGAAGPKFCRKYQAG